MAIAIYIHLLKPRENMKFASIKAVSFRRSLCPEMAIDKRASNWATFFSPFLFEIREGPIASNFKINFPRQFASEKRWISEWKRADGMFGLPIKTSNMRSDMGIVKGDEN